MQLIPPPSSPPTPRGKGGGGTAATFGWLERADVIRDGSWEKKIEK